MFNVMKVRTHKDEHMGFFARLKLGGLALDVAQWAGELVRQIDVGTVLAIIGKVVELERNRRGIPGTEKLRELLGWLRESYPGVAGLQSVASFVSPLIASQSNDARNLVVM